MENLFVGTCLGPVRDHRPVVCTGCGDQMVKGSPGAEPSYGVCIRCRQGKSNKAIGERRAINRAFNPDNEYREKRSKR